MKSIEDLGTRDKARVFWRHYVTYPVFGRGTITDVGLAREIIEYYDGLQMQNVDVKAGSLGFGLLHYSFIVNLRPERILCIGSKKGFVPALCALACKHIDFGTVDFVDAGYDEDDGMHQWGGVGLWKKQKPKDHFSFLGLSNYINTYVMTTEQFIRTHHHNYQYIYIDGDHSYLGVRKDYRLTWPILKPRGYMVFHDTITHDANRQLKYGVGKLWKELKHSHKLTIDVAGGVGFIQKT